MTGYTKLFGSIIASTIWRESKETKIVWITMLAMANKFGVVESSIPGLADFARVSLQECEQAIQTLSNPDPYSRTTEHDGRRIKPTDGGWVLLNHGKYRAKMSVDDRREYLRRKQEEYRRKTKQPVNTVSTGVNKCQLGSTLSTHAEAEAEAEAEAVKKISTNGISMDTSSTQQPPNGAPKAHIPRFEKPTIEAIKLQCSKIGLPDSEAIHFFNHYESNGWKVGRNPMRSWPAALVNWRKNFQSGTYSATHKPPERTILDKQLAALKREVDGLL